MALTFAVGLVAVATAHAAFYDVVFCAGGNGSGNPVAGARPGAFDWNTDCGAPSSYPSDGDHYLRLSENTTGAAGQDDEVSLSWYAPPNTSIVAGGGYTREPNAFNAGWRGRFWGEDWGGGVHNIMLQGSGNIEGQGEFPWITKNTTSTFASHLWPFGGWDDFKRFVFGLACVRPGGCDRTNFNAVDANTITLVVDDRANPQVAFVDAAIHRGDWVRGYTPLSWHESDQGSGLRYSRLKVDDATLGDGTIDYGSNGGCHIGYRDGSREFGKGFQPCAPGPYQRWYGLETKNLSDGQHTLAICVQDYGQYKAGTDTCDRRTIHTDNTAPGKPAALQVTSANPERYLDHFGATFSLPPNQGSPITKVHYDVIDAAGKVVVAEKTLPATNPTSIPSIAGPQMASAYQLRVWLEDQVGLIGPAASAPIPHDTTPPGAPQGLWVASPRTPHSQEGFDLRWQNIVDSGSPIAAAHYEVLGAGGGVVVPNHDLPGENIERAEDIETPRGSGEFSLRIRLTDAEGNVGAPVTAPLSYDCVRSDVQGGTALSAGFGEGGGEPEQVVPQGTGATINGVLRGASNGLANASLCVLGQVITGGPREFLGIAVSGVDGRFQLAAPPGPSRRFEVIYRPGQRQLSASTTLYTRVQPTFNLRRKVVHAGQLAHFFGDIPGPSNDQVVVVLQVKQGEGWRVFRRYRTRGDGHYVVHYPLRHTTSPARFVMRAQVRETVGYPYLQGNSREQILTVLPSRARRRGGKDDHPGSSRSRVIGRPHQRPLPGRCRESDRRRGGDRRCRGAIRATQRPRPTRAAHTDRGNRIPSSSTRRAGGE